MDFKFLLLLLLSILQVVSIQLLTNNEDNIPTVGNVDISNTKAAEEAKKPKKRGRPRTKPLVSKYKLKGISFNYEDKSNKEKTKAKVKIDHFDVIEPKK